MPDSTPTDARCPFCERPVAVLPVPGRACPECASEDAWTQWRDRRLVIGESDIAAAVARRSGDVGGGLVARCVELGPTALAAALAVVAAWLLPAQFRAVPLGPLEEVLSAIGDAGRSATFAGILALTAGVVALLLLRRSRLYRSWLLLALASSGIAAGVAAVSIGGFNWYAAAHGMGWEHTAPPALDDALADAAPGMRPIMEATAIILAPDRDGDARRMSMGTGAVIGSARGRTWIVTSSHVAMPYASSASFRDPASAQPVWVYLADGRNAVGRVAWTAQPPLDVAIVELEISDPPRAVRVARDASYVRVGDAVKFVPNPMRHGWRSHGGSVSRTEPHLTTAGAFTLIFTTLPAQPGDSGSGMYDAAGVLVGLTTWGRADPGQPTGISLPSDVLESVLDDVTSGDAAWASNVGGAR